MVLAVTVVSNGVQRIFNWNPKWFAWAIAELLCFAGLLYAKPSADWLDYLLTVINGFLVFSAAAGTTSAGNAALGYQGQGALERLESLDMKASKPVRRFWMPWL